MHPLFRGFAFMASVFLEELVSGANLWPTLYVPDPRSDPLLPPTKNPPTHKKSSLSPKILPPTKTSILILPSCFLPLLYLFPPPLLISLSPTLPFYSSHFQDPNSQSAKFNLRPIYGILSCNRQEARYDPAFSLSKIVAGES